MVLRNANAVTEHDRRRSGFPNAPLDMKYDNSSIEPLNVQHIHVHQISHSASEIEKCGSFRPLAVRLGDPAVDVDF